MELVVILVSVKCYGSTTSEVYFSLHPEWMFLFSGWEEEGRTLCCLQGTWMTVTVIFNM